MAYLEENEWMIINEITYNTHWIYSIEDFQNMLLDMIKFLIDYDVIIISRIKQNDTGLELYGAQCRGIDEKHLDIWLHETLKSDYSRWMLFSAKNLAFRESDLSSGASSQQTDLYKLFYAPYKLKYSMGICFVFRNTPLAILKIYRCEGKEDFCMRDMFILNQLHNHFAYRFSYEVNKGDTRYFWAKGQFMRICEENHLTSKEAEIFTLTIKGMTNLEIGNSMKISVSTVKKHLNSIYTKMGVKNRVQLLQYLPPSTNKINYGEL